MNIRSSVIQGCIEVSKIVSVNNYLIRTRGTKSTLTKQAKIAKEEYLAKLSVFKESIPSDWKYLSLTIGFYFNKYFDRRDLSNCVKIFEDCLFEHFKRDDSINMNILVFKRKINNSNCRERIYFRIEKFDESLVFSG